MVSQWPAQYARCPQCARTVPVRSGEVFCVNDGARLVTACPACTWPITSPYARYCPGCGGSYEALLEATHVRTGFR
ncbi:double zinc ribbon domain-containing protein [Deinococcus radiotolerans]|uniref:DZANK-type domain-containing protein n=1 Tax=Deinococcus radiotolerans TaxID=1309407 RepID=A0ABQ2FHJ0_9DEIO|nr:zinc ribbon domain-containing protein [Deinococcus radiotolerans]GGK97201.1 hypothetical protein GCM10010844_14480 [Deinococcus radiotolerans]